VQFLEDIKIVISKEFHLDLQDLSTT